MFQETLLLVTVLLLGLRHGFDVDHIAAIADIAASERHARRSLLLGTLYAAGHASVVTFLGIFVVLLDVRLPNWLDAVSEALMGLTLILLGAWVFYSLLQGNTNAAMRSRWMVLYEGARRLYYRTRGQSTPPLKRTYSFLSAWGVGMIHGIGAETPTQLLLIATVAGAGHSALALLLILTFVLGLFMSNTILVLSSTYTFTRAAPYPWLQTTLALFAGTLSLGLGMWVLGQATGAWFLSL